MHYNRLPGSSVVGSATTVALLTTALEKAKQGYAHYCAMEPIEETPIGGSVLYPSTTFAPIRFWFGQPLASIQIAHTLLDSIPGLQYPLPPEHRIKWEKGFEIRKAIGPRGLIIIALTTWVEP